MEYTDQSADEIRLYVVTGTPDLQQFMVLAEAHDIWNGYRLHYGILGASHFVSVYRPDGTSTHEICACAAGNFRNESRVLYGEKIVATKAPQVSLSANDLEYSFIHYCISQEDGQAKIQALSGRPELVALHYQFPNCSGAADGGFTGVYLEITDDLLTTHSIHTYPNEGRTVYSHSTFSAKK